MPHSSASHQSSAVLEEVTSTIGIEISMHLTCSTRSLQLPSARASSVTIAVFSRAELSRSTAALMPCANCTTSPCASRSCATVASGLLAAMPKLKEFQKQLPDGFIFRFAGEQKEQVSGFGDLTTVLVICVFAIYLALLAQFKHAFKPLIVFAAIPYGVVGAIFSLAIMGQPFGFMAFLGIKSHRCDCEPHHRAV